VPAAGTPVFAIATTPTVYLVFAGGLSTTVYPGKPWPVALRSPPWIRKPGMIRWKIVPSKYFLRTSAPNEAATCGEVFWSRVIANVPSLVWNSTV